MAALGLGMHVSSPLEGLRVLDISNVIAGPFAAALLADFGAEVVKAELPGGGDALRTLPPHKDGKSLLWKAVNRNKRAITLDLRKPEGQELFKRLLPRFDVLVENYRPGTLDRWGLPRETLWSVQPKLTILRVTGFGQTGPYRGLRRLRAPLRGVLRDSRTSRRARRNADASGLSDRRSDLAAYSERSAFWSHSCTA